MQGWFRGSGPGFQVSILQGPFIGSSLLIFVSISTLTLLGDDAIKVASTKAEGLASHGFVFGAILYGLPAFGWFFLMRDNSLAMIGAMCSATTMILLAGLGYLSSSKRSDGAISWGRAWQVQLWSSCAGIRRKRDVTCPSADTDGNHPMNCPVAGRQPVLGHRQGDGVPTPPRRPHPASCGAVPPGAIRPA
jgi:hypothetical protein